MPQPNEIIHDVKAIFETHENFLCAYQILPLLPQFVQLLTEQGKPGLGSGSKHSSVTTVSQAAVMLVTEGYLEMVYLDTLNMHFHLEGDEIVIPSNPLAFFRRRKN